MWRGEVNWESVDAPRWRVVRLKLGVVVCGVTFGEHAFIGAGAVVTRNVAAHAFVVGHPGRLIGWAYICGERLPRDLLHTCGRVFVRQGAGLRLQGG